MLRLQPLGHLSANFFDMFDRYHVNCENDMIVYIQYNMESIIDLDFIDMAKKNITVILNQDIPDLGKSASIVKVANGYARNYLFPNQLASFATSNTLEKVRIIQQQKNEFKQKQYELINTLKSKLELIYKFSIKKKISERNLIFGSVSTKDILDVIDYTLSSSIDKNSIVVREDIKHIGIYLIKIDLNYNIIANIKLQVLPEII